MLATEISLISSFTINETIKHICSGKFLLPTVQEGNIWSPNDVVRLFDSLVRRHSLGSFVFWSVGREKMKDYKFYPLWRDQHESCNQNELNVSLGGAENVLVVLDGKRRLASLYVALKGINGSGMPGESCDNDIHLHERKLHFNLLSKPAEDEPYRGFKFLTSLEASGQRDENTHWFEIGKVLEFRTVGDANNYLRDSNLIGIQCSSHWMLKFFKVFNEKGIITGHLETCEEVGRAFMVLL
ncbi:MAG: DUF262 domain-containing protein [Candidatus Atabeyarchaeum deiterrae]